MVLLNRLRQRLVLTLALSLATGPGVAGTVGAELVDVSSLEPDCSLSEDATAIVCEFPDACDADTEEDVCAAPASCELVEANVVRCETAAALAELEDARAIDDASAVILGGAELQNASAVQAYLSAMGYEPQHAADGEPRPEDLILPDRRLEEPANASARCGWDAGNGTFVCEPAPACEEREAHPACREPSSCERVDDRFYRCEPQQGRPLDGQRLMDDCEQEAAQVERCKQLVRANLRLDAGALEAADRVDEETASVDDETKQPERALAQAQRALTKATRETTTSFEKELGSLRSSYHHDVDELRAGYDADKQHLRAAYEDCRASVGDDLDADQQRRELDACAQEARQALDELRAEARERYLDLRSSYQQRADEALQRACEQARSTTTQEIGRLASLEAGALTVPEGISKLCPAFADGDLDASDTDEKRFRR